MKIGIVTSGLDMLGLLKILVNYNHQYHIYRDWNNGPYGDKGYDFSINKIFQGIDYLDNKVDKIIVPSIYEKSSIEYNKKTINLFEKYTINYCLKYSLIGKIGFVGDYSDMQVIQKQFQDYKKLQELTKNQQNIKNFKKSFPIWKKETTLWKHFLLSLGNRDRMVRKVIKHDLGYFFDSGIDTLIPLNWSYLMFEKIIDSKTKKIRFYGSKVIKEIILEEISNGIDYSTTFYTNGTTDLILNQKKWLWLFSRGKEINPIIKNL